MRFSINLKLFGLSVSSKWKRHEMDRRTDRGRGATSNAAF